MRKLLTFFIAATILKTTHAQSKEFEGVIEYKVEVNSKTEDISAKNMKTLLFLGDKLTVYIKQGNYKRISDICEEYYVPAKQKAFIKFKGIDTLFFVNYNSDTGKIINVSKTNEIKTIAGYQCKAITFNYAKSSTKHFYAPALYLNPKYDANNTLGNYNLYTKETQSIWLGREEETEKYKLIETCNRLQSEELNDTLFQLPDLPQREFSLESIINAPVYPGKGWEAYLQQNLNAALGAKYIKIPKGETEARQTVQLSFIISNQGEILDIQVLNKNEVHRKLAEEAVRVVKESTGWKPANIFGVKTFYKLQQPITFVALTQNP
jgi:hypothetical protein